MKPLVTAAAATALSMREILKRALTASRRKNGKMYTQTDGRTHRRTDTHLYAGWLTDGQSDFNCVRLTSRLKANPQDTLYQRHFISKRLNCFSSASSFYYINWIGFKQLNSINMFYPIPVKESIHLSGWIVISMSTTQYKNVNRRARVIYRSFQGRVKYQPRTMYGC